MDIEEIRLYALSLPHATEDMPFGEGYVTFRVGGKIFCGLALEIGNVVQLKWDPAEFDAITAQYPEITQAWHWHKRYWIQFDASTALLPRATIETLIDTAYRLVYSRLPRRVRTLLEQGGTKIREEILTR